MTDTISPPRTTHPVWNQHPFTCPACERHFAPNTIRIKRHDGQWLCHRCQIAAAGTRSGTPGQRVAHDATLGTTNCATCHTPLAGRRIVINTHGLHVHYRCPKKHRTRH